MNNKEKLQDEVNNKIKEHTEYMKKKIEDGIISNETQDMEYQKKFADELNEYIEKRKKELGIK